MTNDDLAKTGDTNDEWIRSRVGIQSRRVARDDETVTDMAEAAGGKALAASGLEPSEVDLVIVATCSPEVAAPNVAATVAYRLGIPAPGAYDLNAACAGFCYAIGAAADSVRRGSRAERAGDRRGEDDLLDRLDRPLDLHHLRRRRRGGRGRSGPGR